MVFKLQNAFLSAFFGALGPFFNKMATLEKDSTIYVFFQEREVEWAIYPYDILCIIMMLWVNTISVKYKMLSYRFDGAFLGTSIIFILGYMFSAGFDFVLEGTVLSPLKTLGALMMIVGIILLSFQEESDKMTKNTNSFYQLMPKVTTDNIGTDEGLIRKEGANTPPMIDKTWKIVPNLQTDKNRIDLKGSPKIISETRSTNSIRMPSRHVPGAVSNLDFIQIRKGYI